MVPYRVVVCREGFSNQTGNRLFSAACSITLVYGALNILFDPGGPWDLELVLSALAKYGLKPEDINYVVCSHGHVDHIGSLNQFPYATIIVGTEVRVTHTPGHTANDVSLVVEGVPELGTVVASGDIFENHYDQENPKLWKENSLKPELQERSRRLIASFANYIIPGHGPMFKARPIC
ncbi:unnamed protein product [Hydatigera taeniaeformis]|uniref:Metallo-beta-lactamase domain-containing protein 1 n=1 Tax=Hydatigena taeniaeformis TaxID=6205 RepID=A0A0R3WHX2_HYDTA|nr:unnamed protein product [Hydatigera taeniaeformis]